MKKNPLRYMPLILILSAVSLGSGHGAALAGCEPELPKSALEFVETEYPGWRILETEDLYADHQLLWNAVRGTETCAGVVRDIFNPPLGETYAVLIIRPVGSRSDIQLLLLERNGRNWKASLLIEENSVALAPVIFRGDPGPYHDFYNRRQVTETLVHSVIYEHLESSALAFVYVDDEVRRVLVSD